MNIIFDNGTAQQRAWFTEAMSLATFPWNRISTTVHVGWVAHIDLPKHHNDFAVTIVNPLPADPCGRPDNAHILIRDDLDDPNRPGDDGGFPRGHFAGKEFYMESVLHELGHVVQSKFTSGQRSRLAAIFNGKPADWNGPSRWEDKRQESDAETFKDVWLPKPHRKFDNRTLHRLQRWQFSEWLAVLDQVCPCSTTKRCTEIGMTFDQFPGHGDMDPAWLPDDPESLIEVGPGQAQGLFPPDFSSEQYLRIRFGGTGPDNSGALYQVPLPNPKFLTPPINFSFTFHYFPTEHKVGYRLNEWSGDGQHWYFDENEQNLAALPVVIFGVWKQVTNESDPIVIDPVTGRAPVSNLFDWDNFGPNRSWWFSASVKVCGGIVSS